MQDADSPQIDPKRSLWRRILDALPLLTHAEQVTIYKQMRNNARADIDFFAMILLSAGIAYFGLLQNSSAVIIGAMLVAPLMSPMIAIGHGIAMGNIRLFRRAARSTLQGVTVVVVVAALLTRLLPYLDLAPPSSEIMARTRPNILDQYVALASGAAAAYALSRRQVAAALPGVAIAAALVPPLCVVGFGLGSKNWEIAAGSLLLFLTNLASIVLASAVVFMALGFHPTREHFSSHVRRGVVIALCGLAIVTIPLGFTTYSAIDRQQTRIIVDRTLRHVIPAMLGQIDDLEVVFTRDTLNISFTAYRYRGVQSQAESQRVEARLLSELQRALSLKIDTPFEIKALFVNSELKTISSATAKP